MISISQANDARKKLLAFNQDVIASAVICLGNEGFRIEITLKPGAKWTPPQKFDGIPVTL